jgi:hypothetical protein
MAMYHFRRNLLKLDQNLSDENIKNLVRLSPECPEDVKRGREYFQLLKKKGLIGPTNYDYVLDRFIDIGREDLAFQLMKRVCKSLHTPNCLTTHLLVRLLGRGREDPAIELMKCLLDRGIEEQVIELMKCKCRIPHLTSGLSSAHQTLLMVFTAKQGICTAHRKALSMLCDPVHAMNEVGRLLQGYCHRTILKSIQLDMAATVYQWPSFSVFEDRGTQGELLENTYSHLLMHTVHTQQLLYIQK